LKSLYLERYAWPGPLIEKIPALGTKLIVVIPCYNEPEIFITLQSLSSCATPPCNTEVLIVINHGETENQEIVNVNRQTAEKFEKWKHEHSCNNYHVIKAFDLPRKKAGVGLARKIGMDEAARRFEMIGEKKGIIACLDADCTCESNYLMEIYNTYKHKPGTNAALVYFEHFTDSHTENSIKEAITNYELHLRYYVQALKASAFPFAFHTVGSCITVASEVYKKQGGMNLRKAGEDFYFLQKIFPLGNITNIATTMVSPSSRRSDRVPFGTGKAVTELIKNNSPDYKTYNPQTFMDFKKFNLTVADLWRNGDVRGFMDKLPESMKEYLFCIEFIDQTVKISHNSGDMESFIKSFYGWFNGFKALKYVHFSRDSYYENVEVLEASNWVLNKYFGTTAKSKEEALELMRQLDRSDNR
jgi:glycosyltransferase involved in cell wall biosynthesis